MNLGDWAAWAAIAALIVGAFAAWIAWLTFRQPHRDRAAETRQEVVDILNDIDEACSRYFMGENGQDPMDDGMIPQAAPFPRSQFRAMDTAKKLQVTVDKLKSIEKKNQLLRDDARRIEQIQGEARAVASALKKDAQAPVPPGWTEEILQRQREVGQLHRHAEAEVQAFSDPH
jgi:hypothetical protein